MDHVTQQPKETCQRTCRGPKSCRSDQKLHCLVSWISKGRLILRRGAFGRIDLLTDFLVAKHEVKENVFIFSLKNNYGICLALLDIALRVT